MASADPAPRNGQTRAPARLRAAVRRTSPRQCAHTQPRRVELRGAEVQVGARRGRRCDLTAERRRRVEFLPDAGETKRCVGRARRSSLRPLTLAPQR
jgi:hypothetical protein